MTRCQLNIIHFVCSDIFSHAAAMADKMGFVELGGVLSKNSLITHFWHNDNGFSKAYKHSNSAGY